MTQNRSRDFAAFVNEALARPQIGGFIESRDAERGRHVAHQVAHGVVRTLRAFVEAPLRESKRIGRALLMAHDVVALLEEGADHFQTIVEHFPELFLPIVGMFDLGKLQNDRKVERHRTDIATADRDRFSLSLHHSDKKARQPIGDVMAPYFWKICETLPYRLESDR